MGRKEHLYDTYEVPIGIVLAGCVFLTIGSYLANGNGTYAYEAGNRLMYSAGMLLSRAGSFIVVNFPLWFGLKAVMKEDSRYSGAAAMIMAYGMFLVVTMLVSGGSLASTAYSSIMGISYSEAQAYTGTSVTYYPLQTGLIGAMCAALLTRWVMHRVYARSLVRPYSALGINARIILLSLFWSALAGAVIALLWPYFYHGLDAVFKAIAADMDGAHLAGYGMLDQILSLLNLNTLIRQPFWYGTYGGTWTSVAGTVFNGDAGLWQAQLASGKLSETVGQLFTPYYIMHIFALPASLAAAFTISSGSKERHQTGLLLLVSALVSVFGGTSLPLMIAAAALCPLLYLMHILLAGSMFALCHALHVNLGYITTNSLTMAAQPGTLGELISYGRYDTLLPVITKVVIIGLVYAVIYFLLTRLYFRHLAIGLFDPERCGRMTESLLQACGGLPNVRSVSASYHRLTLSLYDPSLLDRKALADLSIETLVETKDAFVLPIGAEAWMIRQDIYQRMRRYIRDVDEN